MVTLQQLLVYLENNHFDYTFLGKEQFVISAPSSLANLKPHCISWVKNKSFYTDDLLRDLNDALLVVSSDIGVCQDFLDDIAIIMCENPKEIFFSILNAFFTVNQYSAFVSPTAVIEGKIGKNAYIGHHSYVAQDVVVGDNVVIKNNVCLEGRITIGKNTIIHSGAKIGTDGYGYYQNRQGENLKVPHFGGVIIGKNVEIGANTSIERGTLDDTIIGDNVKIDDLCHIGHNSIIDDNCSIVALSMVGGSVRLGKNVYVAPGVMIRNQLSIEQNSLLGMGAVVVKDVEAGKVVAGVPAKVMRDNL